MDTHNNARLTPTGREHMVRAVVDGGLSKAEAARQFNTNWKTVDKWVRRFRTGGRRRDYRMLAQLPRNARRMIATGVR